jgi:alkanesulfonate monooxygenase SsuD/methylene tetrahydromethanopterin reductase-like flavin-dependent oxidoreductase (luciferase family)
MLFGLNVSPSAAPGTNPVADARRAEELGFDFVSVNDHLHGTSPRHETWTLLTWIAASTSRIGVLPRVLGLPYRHPPVVAKMAETLDRLSGGRLILGLGGGASDAEFRAFGLDVPSPRDKVDGLEEAVGIIRGMWSEPSFTFEGRRYHTDGAELEPKPARRIPIWLGTLGPRALEVTGRVADGWIPSYDDAPPERARALRERILSSARRSGRGPDEITCAYNMVVRVDERAEPDPGVVSGSAHEVAERLRSFAGIGFSAFNFILSGEGQDEQAERLAREVFPRARASG